MTYTIQAAKEASIGQGVNGMGRRVWIKGFYVVSPSGRRIRAFDGKDAEKNAQKWADHCNQYPLGTFTP